jgi:hypothetical protein
MVVDDAARRSEPGSLCVVLGHSFEQAPLARRGMAVSSVGKSASSPLAPHLSVAAAAEARDCQEDAQD